MSHRLLCTGALFAAILSTTAMAQTTAPLETSPPAADAPANAPPPPALTPADPFAQAIAARQVADFARRERDPLAMLTAARMLQQIPFSDTVPVVTDSATTAQPAAGFTANGLFDEASAMAKGDTQLLTQIQVAKANGTRGVVSSAFGRGLVRLIQDVGARGIYRFNIMARGGEPLRVGAIGDIGTSISIRLLDAAGKMVCMDDNQDYAPVCALTPKAGGNYRVDVVNKSTAKSRTVILSN